MTIATLIFANSNSSFLKVKSERLKKEQNYCHIVFGNSNRSQIISKILKHNKTIVTLHKCPSDIQPGCKTALLSKQTSQIHSARRMESIWKHYFYCNIQKHNFFYFLGKSRIHESILCNTGVRHKENDKAVHLPFQEGVQAF